MDKRGSHADWAISMGIFLIYLLALFIIIRPGTEKVYDEKVLLDIIEDKFNEEVKWVVKMSPLFVKKCSGGGRSVTITVKSEDWDFKEALLNGKSVYSNSYCIPRGDIFTLTCGKDKDQDRVCPSLTGSLKLYYTPESLAKRDINPNLVLDLRGVKGKDVEAEVGSSENLEGINRVWLNDLKTEAEQEGGYDKVKERWNFPESGEFLVLIDDEKIGGEPYENVDVFVREWKDFVVNEKGERKEVNISIKVW